METGIKAVLLWFAAIIAAILLCLGLYYVGVYIFGGAQRDTADYRGKTSEIEKTRANGDYRIQAYETFFDQCNQIRGKMQTISQMEHELKTATDPQRVAFLQQTLTGIKASLNTDIGRYNSDAAKEDTVGHFRSSGLPYAIDIEAKEVTCSS